MATIQSRIQVCRRGLPAGEAMRLVYYGTYFQLPTTFIFIRLSGFYKKIIFHVFNSVNSLCGNLEIKKVSVIAKIAKVWVGTKEPVG